MPLIIFKWKNLLEKCTEFVQNSQIWCTEFPSYVHRIFNFFAQNSDIPIYSQLYEHILLPNFMIMNELTKLGVAENVYKAN